MDVSKGAPWQVEYNIEYKCVFCVRGRYTGCGCRRSQESDGLVIRVPVSCSATSARPAMGSHKGAAVLIAAGQRGEMFL